MEKIVIKAEGFRHALHVPVGQCLRLAPAILKKTDEELHRLLKEPGREMRAILKECRKQCGKFSLVDIETADGETVTIVL